MTRPILHTLICSPRPGRVGPAVAQWAHGIAEARVGREGGHQVQDERRGDRRAARRDLEVHRRRRRRLARDP